MNTYELLFVTWSLFFQIVLIVHFALRKWRFAAYTRRYGWLVYALGIPAAILSAVLFLGGMTWLFWLGGLLQLSWSLFGCWAEYVRKTQWRRPVYGPVLVPYLFLYLSTLMFHWWPLAQIDRLYWHVYAVLFLISTFLNITSHRKVGDSK